MIRVYVVSKLDLGTLLITSKHRYFNFFNLYSFTFRMKMFCDDKVSLLFVVEFPFDDRCLEPIHGVRLKTSLYV